MTIKELYELIGNSKISTLEELSKGIFSIIEPYNKDFNVVTYDNTGTTEIEIGCNKELYIEGLLVDYIGTWLDLEDYKTINPKYRYPDFEGIEKMLDNSTTIDCECGAKHTRNANCHAAYCPMFKDK